MTSEHIEALLGQMSRIYNTLQAWHEDFHNPSQQYMRIGVRPTTWENRLDSDELLEGKLFSTSYTFSHFPIAMALVYFDGIRIQLLKNMGEMYMVLAARFESPETASLESHETSHGEALAMLQCQDLITSVTRILQSAEYFFESDKKLVGPTSIMFAFHVAFSALCRLSKSSKKGMYRRQLRWCQMISEKYEEVRLASLASLDLGKPINAFFEMLSS